MNSRHMGGGGVGVGVGVGGECNPDAAATPRPQLGRVRAAKWVDRPRRPVPFHFSTSIDPPCCRLLPSFTAFLPICVGFYWPLPGFTGLYWVLLGFIGFYWVLLGFTGLS